MSWQSLCDVGPVNPILFQIGALKIHWYGLFAAIGFYMAFLYGNYQTKRQNLPESLPNDLFVCGVFGGLIGARLLFVITFWEQFQNNLLDIFKIWQGGLIFNGGFIGAALAILIYVHYKKWNKLQIADILAVCVPIGHAFGRIGCWINGCCFGKTAHGFLCMRHHLPDGSISQPYFPIQLLGTLGNLLLALFLFLLSKKLKRPGWLLPIYFICYGTTRFFGEFLRGDNSGTMREFFGIVMTPAQQVSICFIIPFGLFLAAMLWLYYRKHPQTNN